MVDETPAPLTPLQRYKSTFTRLADVPDEQVIDSLYDEYGKSSGMDKRDFALAWQGRGPRMSPLESGIANLKSALGTAKAVGAHVLGADESASRYLKEAQDIEADVKARYQPEVPSYEDIDSPYKFGRYLYEKAGESAPQMGLQMIGGIGGLGVRSLLGKTAQSVIKTGAGTSTISFATTPVTATTAATTGSVLAGFPAYVGSNVQRQMEEGTKFEDVDIKSAVAAAAAQSGLDTLSLATVFKGIPGVTMAEKTGIFTRAVVRGVESGATEALTETAQQALEIAQHDPQKLFEFGPSVQKELKEAAVAGALLGGAMGGVSGAVQGKAKVASAEDVKKPEPPAPPKPGPEPVPEPAPEPRPEPVPEPAPEPKKPGLAPRSFGSEDLTIPSNQRTDPVTGREVVSVDLPSGSVTVDFSNDFDRALHFANDSNLDPKVRQEYKDFLTYQGLNEQQITDLGEKLNEKIRQEGEARTQTAEQGPLTIDFSRVEHPEIYNNLPQIAKTWADLKQQGFGPTQISEDMSGATAHQTAALGPVSAEVQKDTNVYYYNQQLPERYSNRPAPKASKGFKDKLEAAVPGITTIMDDILKRLYPGTNIHVYNFREKGVLGHFAGAWRFETPATQAGKPYRPGEFGIGINLDALLSGIKNTSAATPQGKMKLVHTIFHELGHPAVDAVMTRLTEDERQEIFQQYLDSRNTVLARRNAAGWALLGKIKEQHSNLWDTKGNLYDPARLQSIKEGIAKAYGVSEKVLDEFVKDPSKEGIGPYFVQGTKDLMYQKDFQEWSAEVAARFFTEEMVGRVPENTMQKFARDVFLELKRLYQIIEAALGVPYKEGAFEKALRREYGQHTKINVDKKLAETLTRRSEGTGYYPSTELQVDNSGAGLDSRASGIGERVGPTPEKIVLIRKGETPASVASTQLPTVGGLDPIVQKLRKETVKPESTIKGFLNAVGDMWKSNSWRQISDNITEAVADKMIKVLRLDERYAEEMKRQGRTLEAGYDKRYPITARMSAYAAALARDNSLAMVETILHHGGRIEYVKNSSEATDGYIRVARPKGDKGLSFLSDLVRAGKIERWGDYARAKRIAGLAERGLKTPITVDEARAIIKEYEKDADIVNGYKAYQEFNGNLMKLASDAGVLTKEHAALLMKNNDYFPFYRELEEGRGYSGPIFTAGLISPTKIAQALGGTEHLKSDPVEVIMKNAHFWVNAATKNVASNKMYTMMKVLGEAADLPAKGGVIKPGEIEGTTRIDGKEKRFVIRNPDLANAIEAMGANPMPNWTKVPGAFTNFYRELVTRDPTYILKNLLRDPFSAMVTSGVNFNPFKAIANFGRALSNPADMQSLLALQNFGVLGGYRALPDLQDAKTLLGTGFDPKAIQRGSVFVTPDANTLTGVISKAWNALGRMSEASDAATRTAVYEEVLARTGDEAEAAFRAQDMMNFRKHGSSQLIRYLSMMVPFVNGRIQGISVAATAFRPENLGYTMVRGGMLFGVAMALQGLTADDKDYQQLPDYVRQGSLVVPLKYLGLSEHGFLSIPKPFEMGFIFQTVPELMIQAYGLDTKEDRAVRTVLFNFLTQTFGFTPYPAMVAPFAEVAFNRSSMTGLPIITQSMEHLPPELQFTSATSDTMKALGQMTGISPAKLETIVKGYGGQVVTTVLGLVDGMYRTASGKGVEKDITQYQPISTFLKNEKNTNPQGVADIYRLSAEIQGLTTGLNNYISYGMVDEAKKLMDENQGLFVIKNSITALRNQLNNLSKQERMIMNNQNISQESRTQAENSIRDARRQISSVMPDLIKYTGK